MTDFYIRASNELADYTCDQTVIAKKKYLKFLSRVKYEEDNPTPLSQIIDWYPFTNSYYTYTEDVDAFARVNHLLETKPSCESLNTIPNCDSIYEDDPYSEQGAQLQYLTSNPVSFLILGKPGIGDQELGRLLADYWKCVYIDPETLIEEEIHSESRAGQCIEFNLRSGRAIGVDIIIRLIEKRIKSKSAQHRGFVVCGFPLIPNDLYEEDPISSESAVFNVREIFEEIFDTTIEVGVPPEIPVVSKTSKAEEAPGDEAGDEAESEAPPSGRTVNLSTRVEAPLDIGSATSNICTPGDLEKNFEDQINFIFSQYHRPFIIIYVVCNNADVISKHNDCRFDYLSKQVIDLQREHSDKVVYTYFSRASGVYDEIPDDFIDVVKNNTIALDTSRPRILLRLPRDFPANMETLLDRYRSFALPIIEKYVLVHDPQYIMKVDGRISPVRMFSAVRTRLSVLSLQKVVLPQKLIVPPEPGGEGGPAEDTDLETLTFEECFELLRKKFIASSMFKWVWSDWGVKCPVSMKEGTYNDGDPKFSVHFMNRIFFLADENAYLKFYRNPRPYLLPPFPKSSCRIYVIGPKCSGKTAVANCLGYFLKGEVLNFDILEKEFAKIKLAEYQDSIRSVALQEGIRLLNNIRTGEWETNEAERVSQVEKWVERQVQLLEETIRLKDYLVEDAEDVPIVLGMSSFPIELAYNKKTRRLTEKFSEGFHISSLESQLELGRIQKTLHELQQLINIHGLPCLADIALCEELLKNHSQLMEYIPIALLPSEVYDVEPATIFDDFVKQYADNAVENASYSGIELTAEHTVEMLVSTITEVEERTQEQGYIKGGWIIDGIHPRTDLFKILPPEYTPDDVFVLKDSADHQFLLGRFETKGLNEYRDYRRLFMDLNKPDAAWRSPSLRSTDTYRERIAHDIIVDVVDDSYHLADNNVAEDTAPMQDKDLKRHPKRVLMDAYIAELNKFDVDWENLSNLLAENHKITITEIAVTEKTLDDLLTEVVKGVEDRYRQLGSVFTAEDRVLELEDFGEPELQVEEMAEGEEKEDTEDLFFQNRRFGDSFNYCPVSFHNHWVLWLGKEEFAARYENKLYFMCNENTMNEFVHDPRRFLLASKPPSLFPPPRICILGPTGSGKTTVSKTLAKNLGVYYVDYFKLITKAIAPRTTFDLLEILKMGIAGAQGEMVENNFNADEPLSDDFLNSIILPIWFEDPKKTFGFVFDGFPKRPTDAAYMIQNSTVPDIIVELSITANEIHKRLMGKFLIDWDKAMQEKEERLEKKRKEIMNAWEERRMARFRELIDLKKEERYAEKINRQEEAMKKERPYLADLAEAEEETDHSGFRLKSQVSYNSVAEEADIQAVNAILVAEVPEPVFAEEPDESLEEAAERFANEIENSYNDESQFLRTIREQCEMELIPWVTVDAGMSEEKVFAQVMRLVDKYKFRNGSLFERVYDISVDLAEKLLSNGYHFLSKFGKTCPVQVYEKIVPVQMYLPLEQQFQLFPVIHRQYIYFLAKKENRDKFKVNPLIYTTQKNYNFPLIPLKLAVIGPPKSGKTTLAERFRRDLGMQVISRGQAGRYALRYLEFSDLAKNMEVILALGWDLTDELVIRCVEAAAYDGKCITQGFVLDGFPGTIAETRYLAQVGLVPHLVIDLQAEHADVFEFLSGDVGKRGLPVFSQKFIQHPYDVWIETKDDFREWLDKEYQTLAKVHVKPSKWGVWTASYELSMAVCSEIKHYYRHCHCDVALRLANMIITPLEFIERQGFYKNYCPCCLHYENALVCGGDPPDRTGVVQFRKFYYYLCPIHIEEFINDPEQFISPYNIHKLPRDLPIRVFLSEVPDNVYEEGLCIICYWDNRPKRVVKKGSLQYAVLYKEKVYLFDRLCCMNKFMREPHKYYAKSMNFKGTEYPSLNYYELPTLGMLQQYDSRQLVRAISNTGVLRPVIPGLSPSISASLNVALYLKLHNPRTSEQFLPLYREAFEKFHEMRNNLINYLDRMKSMLNPYLYYDEPLARRVPVPDDRFDYLCNYFKPVSKVPAFLNIVDIAGLVKGASEGQGLGNAFLSHISACDAIFHLLRAFEDTDVTHVEGEVDPVRDLEIIGEELRLKDEEQLMKHLDKLERSVRGNDKKQKPEFDALMKVKNVLVEQKLHIRFADWSVADIEVLNKYLFLTSKPMIYLVNLAEKDYIKKKNKWLPKIKEWIDKNDPGATLIPFSGMFEHNYAEIEDPILQQKFLEDSNVHSALDKIILQGYKALQLEYFFTAGADEVKAWTIQKGTKAPQAAGKIHTDFEKGFIMAEVMKFSDFKEEGSETAVKAAGKYRQQGRNYVVEDGDIIFFKFNAGAGLKDAKKK